MHFTHDSFQDMLKPSLANTVPSISWKYNRSSSALHNQSHLNWMFWHTGRRPETFPAHTNNDIIKNTLDKNTLTQRYQSSRWKRTQCFRSTSSSASHFRVRNGRFLLMISPAKNVVSVGYSWKIKKHGTYNQDVSVGLLYLSTISKSVSGEILTDLGIL